MGVRGKRRGKEEAAAQLQGRESGGQAQHICAATMRAGQHCSHTSTRGTESTAQQGGAATWGTNLILLHEPNADAGLVIEKAEDEVDGLHHALCTLSHFRWLCDAGGAKRTADILLNYVTGAR